MKTYRAGAVVVGLSLLLVVGLTGQAVAADDAQQKAFSPQLHRASDLLGMQVVNTKGEELGSIEDLVLNSNQSRVAYGVLSYGGILGIGDKYFAVPFQAFELKKGQEALVLDVSVDRLKQAKGFDQDNWPDMGNSKWAKEQLKTSGLSQELQKWGGEKVSRENFWARKVSEIIGTPVRNQQGEGLGEIENLMIDMNHGTVGYAIVGWGGVLGVGENLAAVPWTAIRFLPRLESARLNVDQKTLEQNKFAEDKWPDFNMAYSEKIFKQFGEEPYWQVFGYVGEDQQSRAGAWMQGSDYNKQFKPDNMQTITGTIQSVGTFHPGEGAADGLRLRVKTDSGETYTIHAGPKAYVNQQKINLNYGDKVTVSGSKIESGWFGLSSFLMATEVKKGDQTLNLRDKRGTPQWNSQTFQQ